MRPTPSPQEQAEAAVAELHEFAAGGRKSEALIEIAAEPRPAAEAQANGEVSEEQAAWDRLESAWNAASWGTGAKFAAWAMSAMAQAA